MTRPQICRHDRQLNHCAVCAPEAEAAMKAARGAAPSDEGSAPRCDTKTRTHYWLPNAERCDCGARKWGDPSIDPAPAVPPSSPAAAPGEEQREADTSLSRFKMLLDNYVDAALAVNRDGGGDLARPALIARLQDARWALVEAHHALSLAAHLRSPGTPPRAPAERGAGEPGGWPDAETLEELTQAAQYLHRSGTAALSAAVSQAYAYFAFNAASPPSSPAPPDVTSDEAIAAGVRAFHETAAYWPPEALTSPAHVEKIVEAVLLAALRSPAPPAEPEGDDTRRLDELERLRRECGVGERYRWFVLKDGEIVLGLPEYEGAGHETVRAAIDARLAPPASDASAGEGRE